MMGVKTIFKTICKISFPENPATVFDREYTGQKVTTQKDFDAEMEKLERRVTQEKNPQ